MRKVIEKGAVWSTIAFERRVDAQGKRMWTPNEDIACHARGFGTTSGAPERRLETPEAGSMCVLPYTSHCLKG